LFTSSVNGATAGGLGAEMRAIWFRRFWLAQSQWIAQWKWFFASLVCGIAAALLSWFFKSSTSRSLVPLVCLVFIVIVAIRFGARSGIIGSILATIVFCFALFPPVGALRVDDQTERANVVWMLLGGISLSYLLSSDDDDDEDGIS
jgi:K+-sensing histidine kinase KdpD